MKPGVNPYKVLGIEIGCTEKEIQKAYRLQCLKWHPDKNLTNKEEAEIRFIAAKEAFTFLFDKTNRNEYDKREERIRVAEEKQRKRMEMADGQKKKLIEDLKRRESEVDNSLKRSASGDVPLTAAQQAKKQKNDELRMRESFEEIRKQLEREANEEVKRQMERVRQAHKIHTNVVHVTPKLMAKWKATSDEDYSEEALRIIFEPYGEIANVSSIIVKKERRKCLIEFGMGVNAWGAETETGMSPGPEISSEWVTPPNSSISNEKKSETDEKPGTDLNSMSLEDLEAQILGGL